MPTEIMISIASRQMADALLSLEIPGARQTEVKKYSDETAGLFYVAIQFASSVGAAVLARWLYDAIMKPGNEKTEIKGRPIPQNVVRNALNQGPHANWHLPPLEPTTLFLTHFDPPLVCGSSTR